MKEILCDKVLISSFFKFQISTYIQKRHRRCCARIGVLRNFAIHRKTPVPASFLNKVAGLSKKETLAQVFSREFSEISKNTFFTEHILVTTSVTKLIYKETLMVNENVNADLRMKLKDKISDVCV